MGVLRTFLAICVIFGHTKPQWKMEFLDAEVAVKIFFIISGFYMSLILDSKYVGKNSYKLFITNRFLRIYPVYWAVLILTILASIISGLLVHNWLQLTPYIKFQQHIGLAAFAVSVLSNLLIYGQDVIMFLGLNIKTGTLFFTDNYRNILEHAFYIFLFIPQAWTLGIELTFYLIAPFILNKNITLVLCLMAASLLIRIHIYRGLGWTWDPWNHRFFPSELLFFLLGNISYKIYGLIKNKEEYLKIGKIIMVVFFLSILIYPNFQLPVQRELSYIPYYCFAFISLPFIFNLTKNSKKDNRIGELSYPIYIVHMLVIWLIRLMFNSKSHNFETPLAVILSILAAYLLLKLIADPIEEFRQYRWARQTKNV